MSEALESPNLTPIEPGSLYVPPHGRGMLRHGSQPGNPAGPGAPSSVIRRRARESLDARIALLERVADGEMVEHKVQAPGAAEPIVVRKSADVRDRLRALKELREIGIGTLNGISDEDVRSRLGAQIQVITMELPALIRAMKPETTPEDVAEALLKRLEPIW